MKIVVNEDRCTGLGICESIAPAFFEVGDDGALVLLRDKFSESGRADIEEAVRSCPTLALSVTDED
jgi:ferredoxin